jgi:PDZ domain/PEGA domain
VCAVLLALLLYAPTAPAQQAEPPDLARAKQLFEQLDYEQAMPLLDRAIQGLEPLASRDAGSRASLVAAFELRARARFGTGDREGATSDFRSVLGLDPGFKLGEGVSPRIVAVLDEVRATTIGTVDLAIDPADAMLIVDGVARAAEGKTLALAAGNHTVTISRAGYRPAEQPVVITAGQRVPLSATLERVSSVVNLITSPPGTEVVINGSPRGKTVAGPLPSAMADLPARLGVQPSEVSQPLQLSDLTTGTFEVEFRRECYVPEKRSLTIDKLGDLNIEPVRLQPAVGIIAVASDAPGVEVRVDSESKGNAPLTLEGLCAGTHLVELRGPAGRAVERVTVTTGGRSEVRGRVRPAFALIPAPSSGTADPRLAVERALAEAGQILLYAPPVDVTEEVMAREPVSDEWFGVAEGQNAPPVDRRERLQRIAEAFDAQGVAWARPSRTNPSEVVLALSAPGGAEPDVLTVALDRPDSVRQALARLDTPLVVSRGSLGLLAIDVLDVKGAVVADVEPGEPAAGAGLKPGDVIESIGGKEVSSASELDALLAAPTADQVSLSVRTGSAAARTVTVPIRRVPVLLAGADRFMPANAIVAVLRSRLATASDKVDQAGIRLNLAGALLQAGDPNDARVLLQQVDLPTGSGVSRGTVQYLLGQAELAGGDRAAAVQAFEAARQAGGRLAADGPAVASLAAQALARLK